MHASALLLALAGTAAAAPSTIQIRASKAAAAAAAAAAPACADNMIIFARGTTEPAPFGTIAGPPFFSALQKMVGANKVATMGVDYPADIPGFLAGGDANGSKNMAAMVQAAVTNCPKSKVIMCGYSQGGQLTHNAAKMLPPDVTAKVAGAIIFGDPNNGTAVAGVAKAKTKVFCATGDNICQHGDLILPAHLSYGSNANQAAQFVASL